MKLTFSVKKEKVSVVADHCDGCGYGEETLDETALRSLAGWLYRAFQGQLDDGAFISIDYGRSVKENE